MADFPTDGSGGTDDGGDWTAEELAAQFHAKQAEWASALAETDGNERAAGLILSHRRLVAARNAVPAWHPESDVYVPGIPPWHPERDGGDDAPPDGGVREPRRPSPNLPSDAAAIEQPADE